jgi:hypothetical protein
MKFKASRLSDGNNVFPDEISIDDNSVTIKSPKLFGGVSKSFPLGQITVSINTPFIGFSDITLFSQGTRMSVHGFSSSEAKKIRNLIEQGPSVKTNKYLKKENKNRNEPEINDHFNEREDEVDHEEENEQYSRKVLGNDIYEDEEKVDQEEEKERFGRKILENGIYEGWWYYDMRHGEGTMTWNDGTIYDGDWMRDLKHGWGKMIYPNGDVYTGEWVDGKRGNGYGRYTWASGQIYGGYWIDGNFHGKGRMFNELRDDYEGEWVKGKKEGTGLMTYANGDIYEGNWSSNERDGKGTMTYANGDIYKGGWSSDKRDGKGTMTYANGDIYEGVWSSDYKDGEGTMIYANGDIYKFDPNIRDPLFEEAARLLVAHQQGSTSLIQRKMKLGYNRAGRIIDQLEAADIVSPFDGIKVRDVLYQNEYSLEKHLENLRTMH